MKWIKQIKCNHEYFKVGTERESTYGVVWDFYHTLYCPKCDKSIEVRSGEATRLLKCQEIKKEFNKFG